MRRLVLLIAAACHTDGKAPTDADTDAAPVDTDVTDTGADPGLPDTGWADAAPLARPLPEICDLVGGLYCVPPLAAEDTFGFAPDAATLAGDPSIVPFEIPLADARYAGCEGVQQRGGRTVARFVYDGAGTRRLDERLRDTGSFDAIHRQVDAAGHEVSTTFEEGTARYGWRWTYDARDHVAETRWEEQVDDVPYPDPIGWGPARMRFRYDDADHDGLVDVVREATVPVDTDGPASARQRDELTWTDGLLASVVRTTRLNGDTGDTAWDARWRTTVDRNEDGRVTRIATDTGATIEATWDDEGRLHTARVGGRTFVLTWVDGRIASLIVDDTACVDGDLAPDDCWPRTYAFAYDDHDRIVSRRLSTKGGLGPPTTWTWTCR